MLVVKKHAQIVVAVGVTVAISPAAKSMVMVTVAMASLLLEQVLQMVICCRGCCQAGWWTREKIAVVEDEADERVGDDVHAVQAVRHHLEAVASARLVSLQWLVIARAIAETATATATTTSMSENRLLYQCRRWQDL